MRTRLALCLAVTLGSAAAAAPGCGGDSEDTPFGASGKDGGAGASGKAGSGGALGSGGSTGGTGGSGGSSGSLGSGGSAGGGDSGTCKAPADRTKASLCLKLAPDSMRFETDPRLDGKGVLIVQVYDTPDPEPADGGPAKAPLAERIIPQQQPDAAPSEISVTQLPELEFDGLPARVYVRAFFIDNFDFFVTQNITWGVWVAGYDFAGGLVENPPIAGLQLTIGSGTRQSVPLAAIRRMNVELRLASGTVPLDNAQGPASVAAIKNQVPGSNEPIFGFAAGGCVNLSGGATERLTGLIVGSGTYYLIASVDDFNLNTGDLPPGGIIALEFPDGGFRLPDATRVVVAADAYSVTQAVPLNFVAPLGDAGTPPSFSCPVADAGRD